LGPICPNSKYGIEIMRLALAFSLAVSVIAPSLAVSTSAGAREAVSFREDYMPGTVVIKYGQRRLYYVIGGGKAISYPVGVGRAGKAWFGTRYIDGKRIKPAWAPPREVKRDNPRLPNVIPGGVPANPRAANTPSTAPMRRARSAASCRMAASACTIPISSTSIIASASAPGWW
jgi:hypothetical protein